VGGSRFGTVDDKGVANDKGPVKISKITIRTLRARHAHVAFFQG
jgi:hypothetical protein